MELYFQFGYGMKKIATDLSKDWGGATAILSPRDMSPEQLIKWRKDFEKANVKTLFDPQCYFPKSQHKGLQKYDYIDSSLVTKLESNTSREEENIKSVLDYNGYVDLLFSGALPSSTAFTETMAFKHYLNCVRVQMKNVSKKTYKETVTTHEVMLENALRRIEYMEKQGVYAQTRSFKDMVDVNRSALQRLDAIRGFQLKQEWSNL